MKGKAPKNRFCFEGDWDRILYLRQKVLYWLYDQGHRNRALHFCAAMERLLKKNAQKHEAIRGEECWSLVSEARGDIEKAIAYRESEIGLIKRWLSLRPKPPRNDYGPRQLADRLDLLAILYWNSGNLEKALETLRESTKVCRKARIPFDGRELLRDCTKELKCSRTKVASPRGGNH